MKIVQPITALFDIDRESFDGRSMLEYKKWLTDTILIFPDLIVFHDGACDLFEKNSAKFVKINKEYIWAFQLQERVNQILLGFTPEAASDITFKNALYSLLQFSKFDLLNYAFDNFEAKSYLWVDAGISRFVIKNPFSNKIEKNIEYLLDQGISYMFEIDLKNNLNFNSLNISQSVPGTCKRVISGTAFWMQRDCVNLITNIIHLEIEKWLAKRVWDNEQVMLRAILPKLSDVNYVVQWNSSTGSVARKLLNQNVFRQKFKNKLIQKLMLRAV